MPVRTPPRTLNTAEAGGVQMAPATTSPEDEFIALVDEAAGFSPLRSQEMRSDVKKLLTPPKANPGEPTQPWIRRKDVQAFLEKYYNIDKVTGKFWEAFTGYDDDSVITGDRLKYCLQMFEKYHKYTGATLKYMAEHKNIYIVSHEGLQQALQKYPGGISALLQNAQGNPFVRRAWESAKYLTGDRAGDTPAENGSHKPETFKWFAIILSNKYAELLADDKTGSKKDLEDLQLGKNKLLVGFYNKYLIRWMAGEDGEPGKGRQGICNGISDNEWWRLLKMQDRIEDMGSKYYGNENALKDLELGSKKAEELWQKAVKLFDDDDNSGSTKNKTEFLRLIGQIRTLKDSPQGQAFPIS